MTATHADSVSDSRVTHCSRWCALAIFSLALPAAAQVTQLESRTQSGAQAIGHSSLALISGDGRTLVFVSNAPNLVPGDTNNAEDVFARDRFTGAIERISVASGGAQGNGRSYAWSVSSSARYVAFASDASNLVTGDTNIRRDIFVRDRVSGTTERVSVSSSGGQANDDCSVCAISDDGRYVVFDTHANNLVPGDTNIWSDIFLRDRVLGTTDRVSVSASGVQANFENYEPTISADGRFVFFRCGASNLIPLDTNASEDIVVHDRVLGTLDLVSRTSAGAFANAGSSWPSASSDGRFVVFHSDASDMVPFDTNAATDIFVRDRLLGTTRCVSVSSSGAFGNGFNFHARISSDGEHVVFMSQSTLFAAGDVNNDYDIFLHTLTTGTTERISQATDGTPPDAWSAYPSISGNGRFVAFESVASNLVAGDLSGFEDVFVRDRDAASATITCEPGVFAVGACPCANPPSGPARGCDNAAASGGAELKASGVAYVAQDTLTLTTRGLPAATLCMIVQANSARTFGVPFGRGVSCAGGPLVRLYVKSAGAGVCVVPDTLASEPPITVRNALAGVPLAAGTERLYFTYYRDSVLSGGCSAASAFNLSNGVVVTWWP